MPLYSYVVICGKYTLTDFTTQSWLALSCVAYATSRRWNGFLNDFVNSSTTQNNKAHFTPPGGSVTTHQIYAGLAICGEWLSSCGFQHRPRLPSSHNLMRLFVCSISCLLTFHSFTLFVLCTSGNLLPVYCRICFCCNYRHLNNLLQYKVSCTAVASLIMRGANDTSPR